MQSRFFCISAMGATPPMNCLTSYQDNHAGLSRSCNFFPSFARNSMTFRSVLLIYGPIIEAVKEFPRCKIPWRLLKLDVSECFVSYLFVIRRVSCSLRLLSLKFNARWNVMFSGLKFRIIVRWNKVVSFSHYLRLKKILLLKIFQGNNIFSV